MFVKPFPLACAPVVVDFYAKFQVDDKVIKSPVRDFELEFNVEELGFLLNISSLGFENFLKKMWPAIDNDVDRGIMVTRKISQKFKLDAP